MRVHFVGELDNGVTLSSRHAAALRQAGLLAAFDEPDASWRRTCADTDVIHVVGRAFTDFSLVRRMRIARAAGVAVLRYWTGVDVLWARCHEATRMTAWALSALGAVQLAASAEVAAHLGDLGIEAEVQPPANPAVSVCSEPRPFPEIFTVLCFMPAAERHARQGHELNRLIGRLPSVRFLLLTDDRVSYEGHANAECIESPADNQRTVNRATMVLDARPFDSARRLAVEALSAGRHVVAARPFPFALRAADLDARAEAIRTLRRTPSFNLAGREYVGREFDGRMHAASLRRRLEQALEPGRARLAIEGRVKAASLVMRMPRLLSRRRFPLPDPDGPSAGGETTRCLLRDAARAAEPQAVSS